MFGLTFDKILVLALLAAFVIGPSRLPDAAAQLGRLVRKLRQQLDGAKSSLRETGGPDLDGIDWQRLDPRQYDPRRIIRDALMDDTSARVPTRVSATTLAPLTSDVGPEPDGPHTARRSDFVVDEVTAPPIGAVATPPLGTALRGDEGIVVTP